MLPENQIKQYFKMSRSSTHLNSILNVILIQDPETNLWDFYYLSLILTNRDISEIDPIIEEEGNVLAIKTIGSGADARNFLSMLETREKCFIVGDFKEVGGRSQYNINADFAGLDFGRVDYQEGKRIGLNWPSDRISLSCKRTPKANMKSLGNYRNLEQMALELFDIDFQIHRTFPYSVNFFFEDDSGKIRNVSRTGAGISIGLDFDIEEKEKYRCFLFPLPSGKRIPVQVDRYAELTYNNVSRQLKNYEVRLTKDKQQVDSYTKITESLDGTDIEKNQDSEMSYEKDVFIMYSGSAKKLAEKFRNLCKDDLKLECFFAEIDKSPTEQFPIKLKENMKKSRLIVFLVSNDIKDRQWIHFELGLKVAFDKEIIVLFFSTNKDLGDVVEHSVKFTDAYNFYDKKNKEEITDELKLFVDGLMNELGKDLPVKFESLKLEKLVNSINDLNK